MTVEVALAEVTDDQNRNCFFESNLEFHMENHIVVDLSSSRKRGWKQLTRWSA